MFDIIILMYFFFSIVCAEAFDPDEEEEDTEQRVRMNELHRAWFSLQPDKQTSVCATSLPFVHFILRGGEVCYR